MESETGKMTISLYEYHEDWLDRIRSRVPLPRSTFLQFILWRLWKCPSANQDIRIKLNAPNFKAELEQMYKDGADFLRVKELQIKLEAEG